MALAELERFIRGCKVELSPYADISSPIDLSIWHPGAYLSINITITQATELLAKLTEALSNLAESSTTPRIREE